MTILMAFFAELTTPHLLERHEAVLVFPAHLDNFTTFNWNWQNSPLPLGGGISNQKVVIIKET